MKTFIKPGVVLAALVAPVARESSTATAVPTGTYGEAGALSTAAQPEDEDVSIRVRSVSNGEGPVVRSSTWIYGEVQLTTEDSCTYHVSHPGPAYDCDYEPARVVLDGGPAHADLSVDMWFDQVSVVLRA